MDIPVRVVTFTPFVNHAGDQFLARHVEDTHEPEESRPARAARVEWVLERAERFGRRDLVEEFIEVGRRFGLGVRPWPKSITLTGSRGRTLVYIQPLPDGVEVAEAPETLMDIFSVSEEDMTAFFGPLKDRWRTRTTGEAKAFLAQFEAFMLAHSETSGMSSEPTDKLS